MIQAEYINVLRYIYKRLSTTDITWVVTGSLGFALQGMIVEVHDIDIQTDKAGAYLFADLFNEFCVKKVKFKSSGKIQSYFGEFEIEKIKVEVMGDIQKKYKESDNWDSPVDILSQKLLIPCHSMEVPVLNLEYELKAYIKMGRYEKALKIREWLSNRK